MKQLQSEARWCVWRKVEREGKITKVPFMPDGSAAKSNDPGTWSTYAEAQAVCKSGRADGVGFFLSADGKRALCGIDVDGDHSGEGGHNPLEAEVLARFSGTYCETSPSGSGAHIIFYADPAAIPTVERVDPETGEILGRALDPAYYSKNPKSGLEVYCGGLTRRYLTYTGKPITDCPVTDQTAALVKFLHDFMLRPPRASKPGKDPGEDHGDTPEGDTPEGETVHTAEDGARGASDADDLNAITATLQGSGGSDNGEQSLKTRRRISAYINRRLDAARNASNGEEFRKLFDYGDKSAYRNANGEIDDSAADLALCGKLSYYLDRNAQHIDTAFRLSGCMRAKWDEIHSEGLTYGEMTIRAAIAGTGEVYKEPNSGLKFRPDPMDLTDGGNADLFARLVHERARWTPAYGWIVWTGKRWEIGDHFAEQLAQQFAFKQLCEARDFYYRTMQVDEHGNVKLDPGAVEYLDHAGRTRGQKGTLAITRLAKSQLYIPADKLDPNPLDLNTPAGIIDLRTGELRKHDPGAMCTKITACSPGDTGADMWREFLGRITGGSEDLERYLQLSVGMSIIGEVRSEMLVIAYGGGANGKSTFYGALANVLGDYAGSIDASTLIVDKKAKGASFATLRGKRLVIASELEQGQALSVQVLKQLCSTDKLVIEMKYKDPETIRPTHHIALHSNVLPRVSARDHGTWRRLCVIPFAAIMPGGKARIENYAQVLAEKAGAAILQWAIDGARAYIAGGYHIDTPEVVRAATRDFRGQDDWAQQFVNSCCVQGSADTRTPHRDVYAAYVKWSEANGERYYHTSGELKNELECKGYRNVNAGHVLKWVGLALDPGEDQPGEDQPLDWSDPV